MSALLTGAAVWAAAFLAGLGRAGAARRLSSGRFLAATLAFALLSAPLVLRIVDRLAMKLEAGLDHSGAAFLFVLVLAAGALGAASGALSRMRTNDAGLPSVCALIGLAPPLGLALALAPSASPADLPADPPADSPDGARAR